MLPQSVYVQADLLGLLDLLENLAEAFPVTDQFPGQRVGESLGETGESQLHLPTAQHVPPPFIPDLMRSRYQYALALGDRSRVRRST